MSYYLLKLRPGSQKTTITLKNFFKFFICIYLFLNHIYFYKFIYFIYFYFWLHWVFVAACRFSLVAVSGGYSSLRCASFSLQWLLLLQNTGSRAQAQQLWLMGSRAQAQQLWRIGLVAPWHVGSSQTRARTGVPCIVRWILNHCATKEAPQLHFQTMVIVRHFRK